MNLKDLKCGMSIKLRSGVCYRVVENLNGRKFTFIGIYSRGFLGGSRFNDDLTHEACALDIMFVYGMENEKDFFSNSIKAECIWRRDVEIEINIKINGEESTLKNISEETLLSIRNKG